MLVTFRTEAYADITMFGDVATELLKMMGHSGTVPSAMLPEDIPGALERLEAALAERELEAEEPAAQDEDEDDEEESDEPRVSLRNRAFPLIELLRAAQREQASVTWEA